MRPRRLVASPERARRVLAARSVPQPLAPVADPVEALPREELEHLLAQARRPGILSVPPVVARSRRHSSSAAVVAVLALVVALGCWWCIRVLWAERAAGVSHTVASTAGPGPGPGASGGPALTYTSAARPTAASQSRPAAKVTPSAASPLIVVHVTGAVGRPGLVRLPEGARVDDAVSAAGGSTRAADLAAVNLARVLLDGEQLHIPVVGEPPRSAPAAAPSSGAAAAETPGRSAAVVDLNSATLADLDQLPGVGPVLAQRILDWRDQHGRFTSIDELGEVSGIGDKLFAQLQGRVSIGNP